MPDPIQFVSSILSGIFANISEVWSYSWWIVLPLISFFIFWDFWLMFARYRFVKQIKWKLLEIKVPKNNLKTPKAMEQVFAAAHAPYSYGLTWIERHLQGKGEYWMSFEIMGRAGETHFYLRLPVQYQHLMESAIFAQYSEAEISEVADSDDYIKKAGWIPNEKYTLFGQDWINLRPSAYPIRSYMMFEEAVEERRLDTMSPLTETISRLKNDEQIWIQLLIRPTHQKWVEEAQVIIDKLIGKRKAKKKSLLDLGVTLQDAILAPMKHPPLEVDKKFEREGELNKLLYLTPGEREVLESIERKIAKLGFEAVFRFLYIDNKEAFSREHIASVIGFIRQFSLQNCNLLRPEINTMTAGIKGFFTNMRLHWRQEAMFEHYKYLMFNPYKKPVWNIEELASLYHYPITSVTAPKLERVESRKGGPPPSLPTL